MKAGENSTDDVDDEVVDDKDEEAKVGDEPTLVVCFSRSSLTIVLRRFLVFDSDSIEAEKVLSVMAISRCVLFPELRSLIIKKKKQFVPSGKVDDL